MVGEGAVIATSGIDGFVAKFEILDSIAIGGIFGVVHAVTVVTVPVFIGIKNHIAVFVFAGVVGVFRVFVVEKVVEKGGMGDG